MVLEQGAAEHREQWNCPGQCPVEPDDCSEEIAERLIPIERLTGTSGLKTCPRWYASQSSAHRAAKARVRMEKGGLGVIDECDNALIEAVEEIDAAVNAKLERDEELRKLKQK